MSGYFFCKRFYCGVGLIGGKERKILIFIGTVFVEDEGEGNGFDLKVYVIFAEFSFDLHAEAEIRPGSTDDNSIQTRC